MNPQAPQPPAPPAIRRAAPADVPRLLDLLHQVNDVHAQGRPDLFIPGRTKYTAPELERILADDATPVFVSTAPGGLVIGYAFCRIEQTPPGSNLVPRRELYLDDLCFDAPFRGTGHAARLFAAVEDFARASGCSRLTLHVWTCNPQAARFYAKQGLSPYFQALEKPLV